MRNLVLIPLFVLIIGCTQKPDKIKQLVNHADAQFEYALERIEDESTDTNILPRSIENGTIKLVAPSDWTSGFFPGNLWMMYELTGDEKWKTRAIKFTLPLENEKWNDKDHDIGFKMYCSFGHAIKYIDDINYHNILIQSAKTLATRYNPQVACIRSWDSNPNTAHWAYPVIIDNMMNLELLLWAAKETGNESFKEIAIRHAQTTMKNHFREDYSCYHVVDYDPETGAVLHKHTHQGAYDESDWARGQAWALYGYTMMYRETNMDEFLSQAENIADYLLSVNGLKEGKVPYWDFKAKNIPNEPLDASAAAIYASALFELYSYDQKDEYLEMANNLLNTLSSAEFLAPIGQNEGFLLKHSTGSKPFNSEINSPLVYADYYYLEAIINRKNLE